MAKEIYFVRHGLTESNIANRVQGYDDPLSEEGKRQGAFLAERLSRVSFQKFLCSDMLRTRETATLVAKRTGHEVEFSPLFREIERPSSFVGRPNTDPDFLNFLREKEEKAATDPHWTYEDEESVAEVIERTHQAFDYAAEQPADAVLVMSHGNFLRKMAMALMLGEDANKHWTEQHSFLSASNTGITLYRRSDSVRYPWQLITWNDHAHLG
ncbi:MAG: histidine phosphatase family protein [Minisyncoccia bacterium]